jgi:predicted TIM-barrel fold metal-dependent hydrolase
MPIILAHPSFPWQDEAIFDLPAQADGVHRSFRLVAEVLFPDARSVREQPLLKDKVLFGSDYPWLTPDRWLADFEKIGIKEEVKPLILKENAVKLLRL